MKRRTVQTYQAAGRWDALLPAPGSVANRSQWTHTGRPGCLSGAPRKGVAPRAGRQLSELAASQGVPTAAAAAAAAAAPSPPRHLRRRGPAPTWRPSRTKAEAAASEKPSGAAPRRRRGSGKVWGLVLRHRSGGAFCTAVVSLSVHPAPTFGHGAGWAGAVAAWEKGGHGACAARQEGGPASARPGAPRRGSVLAPRGPWSTSAQSPGPDASRALVSVFDPPQPPKGTGGATWALPSIQLSTPPSGIYPLPPPPLVGQLAAERPNHLSQEGRDEKVRGSERVWGRAVCRQVEGREDESRE